MFTANSAKDSGGGILVTQGLRVKIESSLFHNNGVKRRGGGLCLSQIQSVIISGSTFNNNVAYEGGGIYGQHLLAISFTYTLFQLNTAVGQGGAVFLTGGLGEYQYKVVCSEKINQNQMVEHSL